MRIVDLRRESKTQRYKGTKEEKRSRAAAFVYTAAVAAFVYTAATVAFVQRGLCDFVPFW